MRVLSTLIFLMGSPDYERRELASFVVEKATYYQHPSLLAPHEDIEVSSRLRAINERHLSRLLHAHGTLPPLDMLLYSPDSRFPDGSANTVLESVLAAVYASDCEDPDKPITDLVVMLYGWLPSRVVDELVVRAKHRWLHVNWVGGSRVFGYYRNGEFLGEGPFGGN